MKKIIAAALAGIVMAIATPAVSSAKPNKPTPTTPPAVSSTCDKGDRALVVSLNETGYVRWVSTTTGWLGIVLDSGRIVLAAPNDAVCG